MYLANEDSIFVLYIKRELLGGMVENEPIHFTRSIFSLDFKEHENSNCRT